MNNEREEKIAQARQLLGDDRVMAFLQESNANIAAGNRVFACDLINRELKSGNDLDKSFYTGSERGYLLTASRLVENKFRIDFGCSVDPEAGDGGTWIVTFTENRTIEKLERQSAWIS